MSSAFDQIAPRYQELWTDSAKGLSQRAQVWMELDRQFRAGDRILDLGCGIGDDALHLASRGVAVYGIDKSPQMVGIARERGVDAEQLAIEELRRLHRVFDGAISDFGALNCVEDLAAVSGELARLIRPGGTLALCLMGRFCWQDLRHAFHRLRGRALWRGMDIRYWSRREVETAFGRYFALLRRVPIGGGDHQLYVLRRLQTEPRPSEPRPSEPRPLGSGFARRQFLADYSRIRAAEGRGSDDSAYYRALPYADLTGRNAEQWRIRARTFRHFVRHVLPGPARDILDLGAGNCWLSYRLAELGRRPVAVDFFSDPRDGLRAARHYPLPFPVVEADFDRLPFPAHSFDLAIFNSSFHYSPDYARTLAEVSRCLRTDGCVVILDSPVYARREYGERMRAERHAVFEQQYGFRSNALGSIEYLDQQMLQGLARELSLEWQVHRPWYGWSWQTRPIRAFLEGRRPPSRFWILVGRFEGR